MVKPRDPHLSQELYHMRLEEQRLKREEKAWLPIEAAIGVIGGNPEKETEEQLLHNAWHQILSSMPDRYQTVLRELQEGKTMEEIGNQLRVTSERARKIAAQAKWHIRHHARTKDIASLLDIDVPFD